jgi:uncharacterized tellurite resistance protein B-like protein
MVLGRLFGGAGSSAGHVDAAAAKGQPDPDTAALRRIVAQLESLPADQRKFVAGFAYILGRVANADMKILPEEVQLMERTVIEVATLPEAEAVLVVEIALNHTALYGGTDNYVITREFARTVERDQLERLLRCAFAVGAADKTINGEESAELDEIGKELGFTDAEIRVFRAEFHDSFGAVREVRRALPAEHGATPVHDTSAGKGST